MVWINIEFIIVSEQNEKLLLSWILKMAQMIMEKLGKYFVSVYQQTCGRTFETVGEASQTLLSS